VALMIATVNFERHCGGDKMSYQARGTLCCKWHKHVMSFH